MAMAHQIDDCQVKGDSSDLKQAVHDHAASGQYRQFRSLAAEVGNEQAASILDIQVKAHCIRDGAFYDIHFSCAGRGVDHQVEEGFLLHLGYIGWDSDYIFRSTGKLAVLLQQVLKQELHIIEPRDYALFHRKDHFYIGRCLLVHLVSIIPHRKNLILICNRNYIFLFPDRIFLFIVDLDFIRAKI